MSLSVEMDGEDAKDDGAEIKFEAIVPKNIED